MESYETSFNKMGNNMYVHLSDCPFNVNKQNTLRQE